MTPLREKMLEELRLRNCAAATKRTYVHQVSRFARHFGRSPAELGTPEVRAWLLHLETQGRAVATRAVAHAALRFLYVETLHRPEVMEKVPRPRGVGKVVGTPLLRGEGAALLEAAADDLYAEALVTTLLGTGMRNDEARHLRVDDIDRGAGLLHVRHGKGNKPRCVPLCDRLYHLLRRYWADQRPPGAWVFPARRPGAARDASPRERWSEKPISADSLRRRLRQAVERAGLRRRVTPHDLRRTYATWLLEAGVDLHVVQVLMGHSNPDTTTRYTRVRPELIRGMPTPLALL